MTQARSSIRTAALALAAIVAAPTLAAVPAQQAVIASPASHVRLLDDSDLSLAAPVVMQRVSRTTVDPWAPLQCAVNRSRAIC